MNEKPVVVDVPARVVTLAKTAPGLPSIRHFDVAAINDAIDRNMKILKPEERVACIAYVDRKGANVAIVGKLPGKIPGNASWTVMGTKEWSGDWNASAALRWSI